MTKLAIMEEQEGAEIKTARTYFRSDFISINLLKNLLRITTAYLIGLLLWCGYNFEKVLALLNTMDITKMGIIILISYIGTVIIFMVSSYSIYAYRFHQNENKFYTYRDMLGHLLYEYEQEEKAAKEQEQNSRGHNRRRKRGGRRNDNIVKY